MVALKQLNLSVPNGTESAHYTSHGYKNPPTNDYLSPCDGVRWGIAPNPPN